MFQLLRVLTALEEDSSSVSRTPVWQPAIAYNSDIRFYQYCTQMFLSLSLSPLLSLFHTYTNKNKSY